MNRAQAEATLRGLGLERAWELYCAVSAGGPLEVDGLNSYWQTRVRDAYRMAAHIVAQLMSDGNITKSQQMYLRTLAARIDSAPARQAAEAEANAGVDDAPEGRILVTGKVLVAKVGRATRLIIRDDRGFRVLCNAPPSMAVEPGDRVALLLTLERSPENPKLAFGKHALERLVRS